MLAAIGEIQKDTPHMFCIKRRRSIQFHMYASLYSELSLRVFSNFSDGSKHDIELLPTFLIIFFLKENIKNLVAQFIRDKENEKKIECFSSNKKERKINSVEG